ncbi:MAG: hypothetical protein ACRDU0_07265, partial [Mycobacterium sp.]
CRICKASDRPSGSGWTRVKEKFAVFVAGMDSGGRWRGRRAAGAAGSSRPILLDRAGAVLRRYCLYHNTQSRAVSKIMPGG